MTHAPQLSPEQRTAWAAVPPDLTQRAQQLLQQVQYGTGKLPEAQPPIDALVWPLGRYTEVDADLASHEASMTQQLLQVAGQLADLQVTLAELGGRLEEVRNTRGRLRKLVAAQGEAPTVAMAVPLPAAALPVPQLAGVPTIVDEERAQVDVTAKHLCPAHVLQ